MELDTEEGAIYEDIEEENSEQEGSLEETFSNDDMGHSVIVFATR